MLFRRSFVGLAACTAAGPAFAHGTAASGGRLGDSSKVTRTIEFVATDHAFSLKSIQVRDGETVRLVVRNDGYVAHELTIGTAAEHTMHRRHMKEMLEVQKRGGPSMAAMTHDNGVWVEPGETGSFAWVFARTPDLEFACNIPSHYEDGMRGAIRFAA